MVNDVEARRRLERMAAELRQNRRAMADGALRTAETWSVAELSAYDNHPADLGSETYEREKDLALFRGESALLAQVEAALERLDAGTYGICQRCHQPIRPERLEVQPWAPYCFSCQKAVERAHARRRPVEEDVVAPDAIFRHHPEVATDGADVWEMLERMGTSSSEADTFPEPPGKDGV